MIKWKGEAWGRKHVNMMEKEIRNSGETIAQRFFRYHQWEEWTHLLRLQTASDCCALRLPSTFCDVEGARFAFVVDRA